MAVCFPGTKLTVSSAQRGKSLGAVGALSVDFSRWASDPLFYAPIMLQNVVAGSRYRITRADSGQEIASGVALSQDVTLTGLPAYANPMLVKIAVRKGTTAPKYQPLDTYALVSRSGATAYISQVPDNIA